MSTFPSLGNCSDKNPKSSEHISQKVRNKLAKKLGIHYFCSARHFDHQSPRWPLGCCRGEIRVKGDRRRGRTFKKARLQDRYRQISCSIIPYGLDRRRIRISKGRWRVCDPDRLPQRLNPESLSSPFRISSMINFHSIAVYMRGCRSTITAELLQI